MSKKKKEAKKERHLLIETVIANRTMDFNNGGLSVSLITRSEETEDKDLPQESLLLKVGTYNYGVGTPTDIPLLSIRHIEELEWLLKQAKKAFQKKKIHNYNYLEPIGVYGLEGEIKKKRS